MTAANPSRPGLREGGSDDLELFRDQFTGEVITAFETQVLLKDKHTIKTIQSGKSASFDAVWKVGSSYHTPGAEILGQNVDHDQILIGVDGFLIADTFISEIDEAMSEWDVRSKYAMEIGRELALQYDRNVCRNILLSSRGAALFTDDLGGSTLTNANYGTVAADLFNGLNDAVQTMDEKDVPVDTFQVYAGFKPAQYYLLANDDKNIDKNFGGTGSLSGRGIKTVNDVIVLKSNAFVFGRDETAYNATTNTDGLIGHPSDPLAADVAKLKAKYQGDWASTVGMVWTEQAAASVHLREVGVTMADDPRRIGELVYGKYATGHGTLRTKCAVELATA